MELGFDQGKLRIEVSVRDHGAHGFKEWLYAFHGKLLRCSSRPNFYLEPQFIRWHVGEVFLGIPR